MKNYFICFILGIIFISTQSIAQQQISYAYDDSGNRVSREIIIPPPIANNENNPTSNENEKDENTEIIKKPIFFEYFKNSTVKIYPNPTYGKLKIELESKEETISSSVKMYDQSGKLIYSSTNIGNQIEIDISSQSKGTYILKIQVGDSVREWKIVKM